MTNSVLMRPPCSWSFHVEVNLDINPEVDLHKEYVGFFVRALSAAQEQNALSSLESI